LRKALPRQEEIADIPSFAMALNSKDERADRLARELAAGTGESITTAVTVAVRERLERLRGAVPRERRREALRRIAERSANRPQLDPRTAGQILGYGPDGSTLQRSPPSFWASRSEIDSSPSWPTPTIR
jgi:antitoxin VapB